MNQFEGKTPLHLWVIGLTASLWNAMGAFDYTATQMRLEFYMSQFTEEQLAYFYGFPAWADAACAIAVWGSLFGSLGLLLRKAWSVWLFAAAVVGLACSSVYNFVLSNGAEMMGKEAAIFTAVIWAIALLLLVYARAMSKRGILR